MVLAALFSLCLDDFEIALRAGAWVAEARGGVLATKGGVAGSMLKLESNLNLDDAPAPFGGIEVHVWERLYAFAEYWTLDFEGTSAFAAAQAYGGRVFPAGSVVESDVSMSMATLGVQYEFDIPLGRSGDVFDRYRVRMEELRQSVRILEQVLQRMPDGPTDADDPRVVMPTKERVFSDMEAVIHHFVLATRGFPVPPGEAYAAVESPRGELGFYVVSDGSEKPYRVRVRAPGFYNLQALPAMCTGKMVADVVAAIGSLDIILGEIDR